MSASTPIEQIEPIVPVQDEARGRLGLIVVIGFIVALVAGIAFAAIAEAVLEKETVLLDQTFGAWVLGTATPITSAIAFNITQLGSTPVVAIGLVVACVVLVYTGRRRAALMLLTAVVGGTVLNLLLKEIFVRPRPSFTNTYYQEVGFAFPSGHAMLSVVFYGALAYVIGNRPTGPIGGGKSLLTRHARVALAIVAVAVALIVGFSRIYLGVHYLTDVLAGWMAGTCWLVTCIAADKFIEAWHERRLQNKFGSP